MTPLDEVIDLQRRYDDLVAYFRDEVPEDRASMVAYDLHEKIMRIIRGEEPDPREVKP